MFSLALYLKFLVIIIVSSKYIHALEKPFNNYTWQKLLFYEDGEFSAQQEYFYLSKSSLQAEWDASLEAIRNNLDVGYSKKKFECVFPARYEFIKKYHPSLKKSECNDFEVWKKELGVKEVYLVYAASYVTNPASMFGHTFLRLSRGENSRTRALTDYSVGFMAITDTSDNPLTYAVKGITGGYLGQYDIKPFYMNVGLYQNSEDRDLWQYKLNLSKTQIDFFIKVLWELSQNTGFNYYFLTQNCSTQILKTLSVVDESYDVINDKNYLFGHPIETLKWIAPKLETDKNTTLYYQSINKQLRANLEAMDRQQRTKFSEGRTDIEKLKEITDIKVLDSLIDYWKFENYKSRVNLEEDKKDLMNTALISRSKIKNRSVSEVIKLDEDKNPILFHDPNYFSIGQQWIGAKRLSTLSFKLGYHGLLDNPKGHDGFSFIDYFGLKYIKGDGRNRVEEINIFEINSFSPYLNELKQFSWSLKTQVLNSHFLADTGLGISFFSINQIFNLSLAMEVIDTDSGFKFTPYIKSLYRFNMSDFVVVIQNKTTKDDIKEDLSLEIAKYFMNDKNLRVKFKKRFAELSLGINF